MSSNSSSESNARHAVSHPLQGAGLTQSLVAQTRHPHDVFHGQRRQCVHEHQRAQLTELRLHRQLWMGSVTRQAKVATCKRLKRTSTIVAYSMYNSQVFLQKTLKYSEKK